MWCWIIALRKVCEYNTGTLQRTVVNKKHPEPYYKHARKSYWGDLWPHEPIAKQVVKGATLKDLEAVDSTKLN